MQMLKQAFTHASYVNEHRFSQSQDNERLEFLGDAVLELTVSEFLYNLFPDRPEGELTKRGPLSYVSPPGAIRCRSGLWSLRSARQRRGNDGRSNPPGSSGRRI